MVINPALTPTTILLTPSLVEIVSNDVRRYGHNKERGGILLGFRRGPHLHINEATIPMRWDVGTMFSFRRSSNGHKEIALKRWHQSDKKIDWVGEWHSHPEKIPSPSSIDIRSWKDIVRNRAAPMAFLILGWEQNWLGLFLPGRDAPIRYQEIERSDVGFAFRAA